jgi:hypothetical protein
LSDVGAGGPLRAEPGDVFLAHCLLGHNKGGTTSAGTRRTIYFRLTTPDHAGHWESTFLDAVFEGPRATRTLPRSVDLRPTPNLFG